MDQGLNSRGSSSSDGLYFQLMSARNNEDADSHEEQDLHVCGSCKSEFGDVDEFVQHKKTCVKRKKKTKKDLEKTILEALEEGVERDAEEAAVISLLANQLNSNKIEPREEKFTIPLYDGDHRGNEDSETFGELDDIVASEKNKKRGKKSEKPPVSVNKKKSKEDKSKKALHSCTVVGCTFSASYAKDLNRHMRIHTGEKPFSCSYCSKRFSRQDKMRSHERIHTGTKPYKCDLCSYSCTESGSLRKHIRVHTDERPYKCQICTYRAKDASQLTVHLRTHTGDCPFICSFEGCSSSFKTKSDLKRHLRVHTGEKPFKCNLCSYKCAIKSNLRNHMRVNHKDCAEVFKCRLCDFSTAEKVQLRTHEETHEGSLFKCPSCAYTATSKTALASHTRKLHSSSKLYRCAYCSFRCSWEGALSAHVNKKHAKSSSDAGTKCLNKSNIPPNFKCANCQAGFVRMDSLQSHLRQHEEQQQQLTNSFSATPTVPAQPVVHFLKEGDPLMGSTVVVAASAAPTTPAAPTSAQQQSGSSTELITLSPVKASAAPVFLAGANFPAPAPFGADQLAQLVSLKMDEQQSHQVLEAPSTQQIQYVLTTTAIQQQPIMLQSHQN